jgi:hypothetical protein
MAASRLTIDPSTHLPSIHTFGELSHFLRSAVADEESLQMSESMSLLASHIEAVTGVLKRNPERSAAAPHLMDLLTILRQHRAVIIGLSPAWRGLYEYAAYLAALNNFRVLIGQWLLEGGSQQVRAIRSEDFELIAWRTLAEGMLMIDMYDQWRSQEQQSESALGVLDDSRVQRARTWWDKLLR